MLQITALSIQSGGGRPIRRGGQGAMDDGNHPFVKTSPFSSSSPSPVCPPPVIKHQQSSPQLRQSPSDAPQHGNSFRVTSNPHAQSNTVQQNPSQAQLISHGYEGQRSKIQASYGPSDQFSLQKAKSLPGYARQNQHLSPQTSFREAFANSRSPTPTRKNESAISNSLHSSRNALNSQNGFNPASFYINQHTSGGEHSQQTPFAQNRQNVASRRLPLEQPFNSNSSPVAHSTPSHRQPRPQQPLPSSAALAQNQLKYLRQSTPDQYPSKEQSDQAGDKKSKRSLLGLFKKKKKNDSKDSFSSDEDQKPKPKMKEANQSVTSQVTTAENRTNYGFTVSRDGRTVVRVAPEKVLASNNCASAGQPLGIPVMIPAAGGLHKRAVSASHDSVMPVQTNQSSTLLSDRSSTLSKRSSSIDNVARKERRQALKMRAENLRTKHRDSSSEEDEKSLSSQSMYGSGHSLNRTGSLTKRSKAARTERYLRRKSHELETLRLETEKDKKNKAAVQARILEIQKIQQQEAERNKKAMEKEEEELPKPSKPRWSANLVYQESNEFDSVVLQTPPATPDSHRRSTVDSARPDPVRQNLAQMRHASSVHARNTSYSPSANNGLGVTVGEYSSNMSLNRRLPSDGLSMGDLKSHRSVSYDCNINKPYTPPSSDHGKSRATPPPPPPRDRSRIVSPADHRPFSYSFENLNRESPTGSQTQLNNKCTTASQGIRAILSHTRQSPTQQYAPRVAITETQLSSPKSLPHSVSLPPLPSSVHALSPQASSARDQAFSFNAHHKVEAPSPQSDVNENERIDHLNDMWKQKSQQRESSRSTATAYLVNGNVVSDSSRSSTPKDGGGPQALYNDALMSKNRAKTTAFKAESTSSLSSRSDRASPVTKPIPAKRTEFLNRESKRQDTGASATQKEESGSRPNMASLERAKREMQLILQKERSLLQTKAEKQKQFEEAYLREKRKLEKNRCTNFEEALHELEELYRSLKLDVEEGVDEEHETMHVDQPNNSPRERGRSRTPSAGRQKTLASAEKDDMHYRRCLQSAKTTTDAKKALQITPSYLLISQAYLSASDPELNQQVGARPKDEPDIVHDDASLRSIKRANAVKVIDPQPPFGIPIGPTTQASPNNYLHLQHNNVSKSKSLPRTEPDPAADDLAFRNLRRDTKEKTANTSELDDILSESNDSAQLSRRSSRSQSADRIRGFQRNYGDHYTAIPSTFNRSQTPRKVKHINEGKKNGKVNDFQRLENGSKGSYLRSNRNTPSWLDRAHLNDPEINGDLSSTKAVSQPDIRSAIIREARAPTGGPDEFSFEQLALTCDVPFTTTTPVGHGASTGDLTAPKLVKIQTLNNSSLNEGLIAKKLFRPPETAFNNKPKPFYLADSKGEDKKAGFATFSNTATTLSSPPVNIAQLESLISTISTAENENKTSATLTKPVSSYSRVYAPTPKIRSTSVESVGSTLLSPTQKGPPIISSENEKSTPKITGDREEELSKESNDVNDDNQATMSAFQKYEVKSAKHNIMNAIRLSMAMGSASSEGNCIPPVDVHKARTSDILSSVPLSSELSQKIISSYASTPCSLYAASSSLDTCPTTVTYSSKATSKTCSKQSLSSTIVSRIFSSENPNYTRSISLTDTDTRFDFQTSGSLLDDACCTNYNRSSLSNKGSHASLEFCSLEKPSLPVEAATYTNKVNAMVVNSQSVFNRARRAHSLPTIAPEVKFSLQRKLDSDRRELASDNQTGDVSTKLIDDRVIDQYLSSREFLFSDTSILNSVGHPAGDGDHDSKVTVHKVSPKPPSRSSSIPPQGLASNRNSWTSQSASLDKSKECSKVLQNSHSNLHNTENEVNSQVLIEKENVGVNFERRNSDVSSHGRKQVSSEILDVHEIETRTVSKVHDNTLNSSNRDSQETSLLTSSDHVEYVDTCDVECIKSGEETDASHSEYESLENQDDELEVNAETSNKSSDLSNLAISNASKMVLDVAVELSNQICQGQWNKTNKVDECIDNRNEASGEHARKEASHVKETSTENFGGKSKAEKVNRKLAFRDIDCSFSKDLHRTTAASEKIHFIDNARNSLPTKKSAADKEGTQNMNLDDVSKGLVEEKPSLPDSFTSSLQICEEKSHITEDDPKSNLSEDLSEESSYIAEDETLTNIEVETPNETNEKSVSSDKLKPRRLSTSELSPEDFHANNEESDSVEFADAEEKMENGIDTPKATNIDVSHESQSVTSKNKYDEENQDLLSPELLNKTHAVKSDGNIFGPDQDESNKAKPLNPLEVEADNVTSAEENEGSRAQSDASPVDAEDVPTSPGTRQRSLASTTTISTAGSPKKRASTSPPKSQGSSSAASSRATQPGTAHSSKRKVPLSSQPSSAIRKTTDSQASSAPLRKSPGRKADLKKPGEASNSASHAGSKVIRKGFAEGVRDAWRDGKEQRSKECDAKGSAKPTLRKTSDLSKNGGPGKPVKIVEKATREKKSPPVACSSVDASDQTRSGSNKVAAPERPLRLKRASKPNLKLNIGAAVDAQDTVGGSKLQGKVTASFSQRPQREEGEGFSPKILSKPSKETSKAIPQYEFGGTEKILLDTGDNKDAHRLLGRSTSVKSDQQSSHETQEATLHIEEELSTPRTGEEGNSLDSCKLSDTANLTTKEIFNSEDLRCASESQNSSESSLNRMVCGSGDNRPTAAAGEGSDRERKERIQRYKEERRKQIAARYGAAEWSSEEESSALEGGEGSESYRAYRRRRRQKEQSSGVSSGGARGGADSALNAGSDSVNNNGSSVGSLKNKDGESSAPASATAVLSPPALSGRVAPDSCESSVLSGAPSASGARGRARPEGAKDKTHKRMSHLNRANTTEEVLLDPDRADDGMEEHPRRRRRRSQLQGGRPQQASGSNSPCAGKGYSPAASDSLSLKTSEVTSPTCPLKTPEVVRNVVSRFTPPPSPPPAVFSTQTVQASPFVPPKRPLHGCTASSPIRKVSVSPEEPTIPSSVKCRPKSPITHSVITASGKKDASVNTKLPSPVLSSNSSSFKSVRSQGPSSAPSTIDHRRRVPGGNDSSPKSSLHKPSIPDVLRSRDPSSNLACPTSASSSSAAKAPAETTPEGMPPTVVRSTLRKAQEIGGTCFMASKRDKKNDDEKTELFKDFSLKSADRWSKVDSPVNVDSSAPSSSNKIFEEDASMKLTKSSRLSKSIGDVDVSLNSEALVDECKSYLGSAGSHSRSPAVSPPRSYNKEGNKPKAQTLDFRKDYAYDYGGQKNGVGGSEGHGAESEPLVVQQKEVKRENRVNFSVDCRSDDDDDGLDIDAANASPSGSPKLLAMDQERAVLAIAGELMHGRGLAERHRSLDSEYGDHRTSAMSPEPQSILKRRHSRDDIPFDRPMTPEPQGILKRKSSSRGSSSRASSVDTLDGELVPILKKKSSVEDLDHFEPKPILKKKSLTDDEFDDRPKSILKSARSGEDLHSGGDSGVVSPTPILKRSGRCDSDGEELLRPILKRRETTDGVRLRVHLSDGEDGMPGARLRSDSAPEAGARRSRSPSESGGTSGASSFPHSVHSSPSHRSSLPSGGPSSPQPHQQKRPSILKKRWSVSPGEDPSNAAMDGELSVALRSRRNESEQMCSTPMRPVSPSLLALRGLDASDDDRPRRVSDRIADMEASPPDVEDERGPYRGLLSTAQSPGTRPKTRAASFSSHRDRMRDNTALNARRSSWASADRSPRDIKFVPSPIRRAVRSDASGACVQFASSPTRRHCMDTSSEEDLPRDNDIIEAHDGDIVEARNRAVYGDMDAEEHPNLDTVASDAARFLLMTASSGQSQPTTSSGVAQKAAFFAQLEQESKIKASPRKERSSRYATQPVTVSEVSRAAMMAADASERRQFSPSSARYPLSVDQSPQDPSSTRSFGATSSPVLPSSPRGFGSTASPSVGSVPSGGFGSTSSPRHYASSGKEAPRTTKRWGSFDRGVHSIHSRNGAGCEDDRVETVDPPLESLQNAQSMEPWEGAEEPAAVEEPEEAGAGVRGILKRDGSREQHDSPRSILKQSSIASPSSQSSSSSYSQESPALSPQSYVHPKDTPTKGILKQMEASRSPASPQCTVVSPPLLARGRQLRGVLKKESSLEDGRGIRSILKPQSDFVRHSSDSSSDDQGLATKTASAGVSSSGAPNMSDLDHSTTPLAEKEDLGAALRQIESLARGRRGSAPLRIASSASSNLPWATEKTSLRGESTAFTSENLQSVSSVSSPALAPTPSSRSVVADDLESAEVESPKKETDSCDGSRNVDEKEEDEDVSESESSDEHESPGAGDDADRLSDSEVTLRPKATNGSSSSVGNRTTLATTEFNAEQILSQSPLFRKKFGTEQKMPSKNQPPDLSSCNTSVNARLAALHKSGNEGWKQRSQKNKDLTSNVTTRQKSVGGSKERPVSLMDRVSKLESSAQAWKVRVTESDASKYTVAHKLAMSASASSVPGMGLSSKGMVPVLPGLILTSPKKQSAVPSSSSAVQTSASSTNVIGSSPPSSDNSSGFLTPSPGSSPPNAHNITESPSSQRKVRRTPQPTIFRSKTGGNIPMMMPQALPGLKPPKVDYRRALSTPSAQPEDNSNETAQTVELFEVADEEFHKFFASASTQAEIQEDSTISLDLADLDVVTSNVQTLGVQRRRVQKHSRHRASATNPVRALASKGLTQYTELRLHAGERELKRSKIEGFSKNSTLAVEALAGLASKENFSAVTLKPVTVQDTRELPPYTHPMLLRVKGRRHAEARLVQPSPDLVNSGDDFILVTPSQVYHYKSEFANVIERSKASEIASFIVQQKDLGVSSSSPVVEITENVKGIRRTRFWEILGGGSESVCAPPDAGGDDEEVEACLARSNKVYRLEGCDLVPHERAWGKPPTVELLQSNQVLVFDFGSEVYLWSGKFAAPEERQTALQLAKDLWEEDYDYSDCDINPVLPVPRNTVMKGKRPSWGILGKITENLETVLFKERFIDWPDTAQKSRIKEVKEELNRRPDPVCCLQPCSGEELLKNAPEDPDLVLEMSHLGRGTEYYDTEERRLHVISTKEYRVWHISEAGKSLLPNSSRCHFHAADTYVVRWYYQVTATGRTLKGAPSKHAVTGRERVAYFFWQGRESSLSDKGASALMTVELDEERGPHHRVTMGSEPPAFLNLFSGSFVIHRGSRSAQGEASSGIWRMFLVRGELKEEAHLLNVPVDRTLLRSRGCTLLVNLKTCVIYLWHGCVTKAHPRTREIASTAAKHFAQSSAEDVGWLSSTIPTIKEQVEGAESSEFWRGMQEGEAAYPQPASVATMYEATFDEHRAEMQLLSKNFRHLSLLNNAVNSYKWTPRMWRLEARHDSFKANEITSTYRLPDEVNPLPFCQDDLYASHIQPALFLVDGGDRVWLWQGWWPAEDEDIDEMKNANCNNGVTNCSNDELDSRNNNNNINNTNGYNDSTAATTGSAVLRFNFARKAALQTALNYAETVGSRCKAEPSLVVAGLEPLSFINLFASWQCVPHVAAIQRKSGRYSTVREYSAKEVLASLSRLHYSLEELRQQPAPDGVDPSRLEDYLDDEDFLETIGKTKKEFADLPQWKKLDLKKKANLF